MRRKLWIDLLYAAGGVVGAVMLFMIIRHARQEDGTPGLIACGIGIAGALAAGFLYERARGRKR